MAQLDVKLLFHNFSLGQAEIIQLSEIKTHKNTMIVEPMTQSSVVVRPAVS